MAKEHIDIIMPCYYQENIIEPGLQKLANQTYKDNITILMINDCSPNTKCEYKDLITKYKNQLDIQYFKTNTNIGPGCVKQLGLEKANSNYIMFHDDDDELYDINSIELLQNEIQNYSFGCISGQIQFIFENKETFCEGGIGNIQGTLFNLNIIKSLNIHFEEELSYKEEDTAFTDLFLLKTDGFIPNKMINIPIYIRKCINNHEHITARDSHKKNFIIMLTLTKYRLKYFLDFSTSKTLLPFMIIFTPTLFNNLIIYLMQTNEKISQYEYKQIKEAIDMYYFVIQQTNTNLLSYKNFNFYKFIGTVFSQNSYFGDINSNVLLDSPEIIKEKLQILQSFIKE